MAGSARSEAIVILTSVRVAGNPDYVPAHIAAGKDKPTSQRAMFRVFHNDGGAKPNVFGCTAWGKLADAIARGAAPGKEIQIRGKLESFDAKVWEDGPQGKQPSRNPDGTFKLTTKVGIKVDSIIFGSDSATLITKEIGTGSRPPLFNVIGSQDEMNWKNVCKQRNAEQFVPGAEFFGYAKVMMPANAQLVNMDAAKTGTGYAQPQNNQYQPQAPAQPQYQAAPPQFAPPVAPPQYQGYQQTGSNVQAPAANPAYAPQQPAQGGYQPPVAPQQYAPANPTQGGYQAAAQAPTQGAAPDAFQPPMTMAPATPAGGAAPSTEMMY